MDSIYQLQKRFEDKEPEIMMLNFAIMKAKEKLEEQKEHYENVRNMKKTQSKPFTPEEQSYYMRQIEKTKEVINLATQKLKILEEDEEIQIISIDKAASILYGR